MTRTQVRRLLSERADTASKGVPIETRYRNGLDAPFGVWEWDCPCNTTGRVILKEHLNHLKCSGCGEEYTRHTNGMYTPKQAGRFYLLSS